MSNGWEDMLGSSPERAKNVVTCLRKGVPPPEDVALFSIGREHLLEYFADELDEIAESDQQGIKFIQADYGHGKTHLLDLLAHLALSRKFIVSVVTLDRQVAPLNRLEKVVPLIMDKIMTPEIRRGGLSRLLQEWAGTVRGIGCNTILHDIDQNPDLALLFPDFRLKLAEYATVHNRSGMPDYEACLHIEKWFRGEETPARTFTNVQSYWAAFVQFVRHLGYSGFVVMLDEAESITLLSRITDRDQADENLRQIIDNQDLEGFYFVFASTPSFLSGEDDRGAQTYPALWRRISNPLGQIRQNALDKIIIELPPLESEEFAELSKRIKAIYEIAFDREMFQVTDDHLLRLAAYVERRTDKSVRTLVRSTVMLLDEARKDQQIDVLSNYEFIVEHTIQDEERRLAM